MKTIFKMIALLLGTGQSQAKQNNEFVNHYQNPIIEHFYLNDQEVSKEHYYKKVFNVDIKPSVLSKTEFVKMMRRTKNVICL